MHPQSELENYKLQVELLQEKLHRSEDNRKELEAKLVQIIKKRNEHERTLRSRSQQKYQQFLDEQKKRNERNRKLVEMLERIDQQAAALSARSDRLKMMKLQYELYFSKLVQSYSMKTLQSAPAVSFLPLQNSSNTYSAIQTENTVAKERHETSFMNPCIQRVPIPVVVTIANEQNRFQPSTWTFATTPPGVLIALSNNSTLPPTNNIVDNKKNPSNFGFDYSDFPIGYLQAPTTTSTPMQFTLPQVYMQQPHQQNTLPERHSQPLPTPDEDIKHLRPHIPFKNDTFYSPFPDVKTNETNSNTTKPKPNQLISETNSDKAKKNVDFEINKTEENDQNNQNFHNIQFTTLQNDSPSQVSHQPSLEVDISPNIKANNSFQYTKENGRFMHSGNTPNTIDFRTDNDEQYIKNIKEMKETYKQNASVPITVVPQELSIDKITTSLQKQQKIDVENDGKINDTEDNERNTSSASAPLDDNGKSSFESIFDEAHPKKLLECDYKTQHNTSYTPARNIDPNRDAEQITLFNGTKNSTDESTRASNRTTAIIDGVGENKMESIKGTPKETSYQPIHFDKKEKMSIENIETAMYGELLKNPESLASTGLPDNPKISKGADEEIVQEIQEIKPYEFANLGKELYQQEQEMVTGEQNQVGSTPVESELAKGHLKEEFAEYSTEAYEHPEANVGVVPATGMQQYDSQNYDYTNSEAAQEEAPQQNYQYTADGQVPQEENYANNYENYDASQYQGEYDPNAYQYEYEQQQYDETNQGQYAPEMYSQEYQQDPYTGEYVNYEETASNDMNSSNQSYLEQQYLPEAENIENDTINEGIPSQKNLIETKVEPVGLPTENIVQINEQKSEYPTSILASEKNSDLGAKKKKRVNFVDSETDENSTLPRPEGISSESDFDFSTN